MSFPIPQSGASLMIAFRCFRKNVLVIGHDETAANRVLSALEADAKVSLVGPIHLMCSELLYRIQDGQVVWLGDTFDEEQLIGNHLVFVIRSDDLQLCRTISNACCCRRIPVNVANQKDLSDFDMTCTYRDQSLQVAISTNGKSPVSLANRILQSKVSSLLSPSLGKAVENVNVLRKEVEALDPKPESSLERYRWLSHICEYSSLDHLASFSPSDISALLKTYKSSNKTARNIHSPTSPISFINLSTLKDNTGIADINEITKRVMKEADMIITDDGVDLSSNMEGGLEISNTCRVVTAPISPEELSAMGLRVLEAGKKVVRVLNTDSELYPQKGTEVSFYLHHGYVPLCCF